MIHKEFKNDTKKVQVFRHEDRANGGYNYYIQVLTKDSFGGWNINGNYKQKLDINSEKVAFKIAKDLLETNI